MDVQQELSVWRRVQAPDRLSAEEYLLPERLEGMILSLLETGALMKRLAGRTRGRDREILLRMSARNEGMVRRLRTLHYLLTGRRLRLKLKRSVDSS